VRFRIQVTPKSRVDTIEADPASKVIRVRVTAAPESGRANEAVVAVLRKKLGLAAGALRIVGGAAERRKWVEVDGIEEAELWRRLEAGS
jgi:uncharacterized protein YggU (UPF0235/DUF167 family)